MDSSDARAVGNVPRHGRFSYAGCPGGVALCPGRVACELGAAADTDARECRSGSAAPRYAGVAAPHLESAADGRLPRRSGDRFTTALQRSRILGATGDAQHGGRPAHAAANPDRRATSAGLAFRRGARAWERSLGTTGCSVVV